MENKPTERKRGFLERVFPDNKALDSSLLLLSFTGSFTLHMIFCYFSDEYAKSDMAKVFSDIFKVSFGMLLAYFFRKPDNG